METVTYILWVKAGIDKVSYNGRPQMETVTYQLRSKQAITLLVTWLA